jgi:diguanylate cyclase (GGDEF)-like protein
MLWNKRKPSAPPGGSPDQSGCRVADPDRALDAVGTLLKTYGRFAFDTEQSAGAIRQQCELWAHRIVLGEVKPKDGTAGAPAPHALRDWHGVLTFFDQQRKSESDYVGRSFGALRRAVLLLARSLGGTVGDAQESDARVGRELDALSRAVGRGNLAEIANAASSVIETTRTAIARRREREARHVAELDQQLRELRDTLAEENKAAIMDELTGLFDASAYQHQLEQLSAIGPFLEHPPWLVVISLDDAAEGRSRDEEGPVLEVSKCVSRAFLRKQDFVSRSSTREFAALLVDMTQPELTTALERMLDSMRKPPRGLRRAKPPTVSIGAARLRPGEDASNWRARADAALRRARQSGGDSFDFSST